MKALQLQRSCSHSRIRSSVFSSPLKLSGRSAVLSEDGATSYSAVYDLSGASRLANAGSIPFGGQDEGQATAFPQEQCRVHRKCCPTRGEARRRNAAPDDRLPGTGVGFPGKVLVSDIGRISDDDVERGISPDGKEVVQLRRARARGRQAREWPIWK